MSTMEFPDGVSFFRGKGGGVSLRWPSERGVSRFQPLSEWIDENCGPNVTADVIESADGAIVAVTQSGPSSYSTSRVAARRFRLIRHHDVSGISGIGVVAHGVEWPDSTVTIRWAVPDKPASTVNWDDIGAVMTIHGHDGLTELEWLD